MTGSGCRSLRRDFFVRAEVWVFRGLDHCGQVIKSVWGMSRRQKAMKGVEGCEKPGGTVKRVLIPGFLNYCVLNP